MSNKPHIFLTHKSGNFYFNHRFSNHKLYSLLVEITILNETIVDLPILPEMASKLELEINYRSIAGTAAIENNPITENDVRKIAEGKEVKGYSKNHKQEIINLIEVYKQLSKVDVQPGLEITEKIIKGIHKDITKNVEHEYNIPGGYRNNEVFVGDKSHGGIYKPPKILKDIQDLMKEFVTWINCKEIINSHPILRAALAHYYLCLIHPFADGNGRTARILEAILLKSAGIKYALKELSNYYYRNIDDYYSGFSKTIELKKKNDVSPFLEVMFTGTAQSLKQIKGSVVEFIRLLSLKDYFRFLYEKKDIIIRQYDFLLLQLQQTHAFYLKDLFNKAVYRPLYKEVSEQTARRDLKKFLKLGVIETKDNQYRINWRCLG